MPLRTAYGVRGPELTRFVEENERVKSWCERFTSGFGADWLSGSRRNKARVLCRFFKWLRVEKGIVLSPRELLKKHQRLRSPSSSIRERQWLLNLVLEHTRDNPDFAEYTERRRFAIFQLVKSFFDFNETPLTSYRNIYGRMHRNKKNRRKQTNMAEAKEVLGKVSQRDRTILLIMLQSGLSIGDVLNKFSYMWHSQVKPQLDTGCKRMKIVFDERKAKGRWYFTYISTDAIHELRIWLFKRTKIVERILADGEKLDKAVVEGEPIFITCFGKPLRPEQFVKQFNRKMRGQVTTHMFRKLFKTEASVPNRYIHYGVVEFWMGHTSESESVGGTYDKTPEIHEEIFEREYTKLEPHINIYSNPAADKKVDPVLAKIEKILQEDGGRQFIEYLIKKIDEKAR